MLLRPQLRSQMLNSWYRAKTIVRYDIRQHITLRLPRRLPSRDSIHVELHPNRSGLEVDYMKRATTGSIGAPVHPGNGNLLASLV